MAWSDKLPETEGVVSLSRTGRSWTTMGAVDIENGTDQLLRRVGIHVRNIGMTELDFIRLYQISFPGFTEDQLVNTYGSLLFPILPITGQRQYIR